MPGANSPASIPVAYNSFVGRAQEIDAVQTLLAQSRLVTIAGPGGVGKTRLALRAAADLAQTLGPVYWCDLATVVAPERVPDAIAAALGLVVASDATPQQALLRALTDQSALIILDNCEHVLAACAALGLTVLQHCPAVRLLATSRQPLSLPQEQALYLTGLDLPPLDAGLSTEALTGFPAIRLFAERAAEARPGFILETHNALTVQAIVSRLDGLPLAIELAAARVRLLEPDQILQRLDDALGLLSRPSAQGFARHPTLRAAIRWSYSLLSQAEQALLRRLSVFRGRFSLDAVEAVCGEGILEMTVLDLLADLADKSLLIRWSDTIDETAATYRLLEVIRQYAREQLQESGEANAVRTRMLAWMVDWVATAEPELNGPWRAAWLDRFQLDLDNLRASLRWAVTDRQVEAGLRLAAGLFRFWFDRDHLTEGRDWLDELLALGEKIGAEVDPLVRAGALFASGRLALRQWDVAAAARRGEESLALYRAAGDQSGIVRALGMMALVAQDRGQIDQAVSYFEEALAHNDDAYQQTVLLHNLGLLFHEQGDFARAVPIYRLAITLTAQANMPDLGTKGNLADVLAAQGDYLGARELAQENLARGRQAGERHTVAQESLTLGQIARQQGDPTTAEAFYREALELHTSMATTGGVGQALLGLGDLAADQRRPDEARAYYDRALVLLRGTASARGIAAVQLRLGRLAATEQQWHEATDYLRRALTGANALGDRLMSVAAVEELAGVWAATGEPERAARLLGATAAWRVSAGVPVAPIERSHLGAVEGAIRVALGRRRFDAESGVGASRSWSSTVAAALDREQIAPSPPALATTPEPVVRVYMLGPARVMIHDQLLPPAAWTYRKARELFFYLLAQPPATKAQIGLDLWPEASAAQLRSHFHRAMHHLRAAFGVNEIVVYDSNVYAVARSIGVWADLDQFEALLAESGLVSRPGVTATAEPLHQVELLDQAVALWRGDFLGESDVGNWAVIRGEELRRLYFKAVLTLGRLHFARADYDRASDAYRRILDADPLLELAHRELMRCDTRAGERSHALRRYAALKDLLQHELEVSPSPETEALYAQIRRGDDV